MKPIKRLSSGFSLAEVVLAIGICSVALMSLIGVLGVSLSAERDSARDTALTAMSSQIVARLSKQPFDELLKSVGSASAPQRETAPCQMPVLSSTLTPKACCSPTPVTQMS
ncbi:hypothetical protein [Verrucomicrobium spinosum]|uniref:hypothetical protein n=1 Tax=Verrucomicrobium spinosum TaxID=2736 RepID=UPI00094678A5|nr:hypothetical protein [Verrucomicrobium spinosum]